jgi:Tol biopolymer transport system component
MKTRTPLLALPIALIALSACSVPGAQKPRVEVPQQFRLAQNDMVTMFEPRIGRIAVTGEDGNILVMDQTGGNVVQLTKDGNRQPSQDGRALIYNMPVWSPDGQSLALVELNARVTEMTSTIEINPESVIIQRGPNSAVVDQSDGGQGLLPVEPGSRRIEREPQTVIIQRGQNGGELISSAVYVASAEGKRPLRELYLSEEHSVPYLDWSPDSSRIAFLAQNVQDSSYELNLIEAKDGEKPRKLAEGAEAAWSWNPDGKTLVAKVDPADGANGRLSLIDTSTDAATRIEGTRDLAFVAPHFSPDGGYMLLAEQSDGKGELVLADREGKPIKTLAQFEGQIRFAWSPAGAKVAYVTTPEGESGGPLHVLDVNSGEDRVISRKPVAAFFWSPDGQRIASFSSATPADVGEDFKGFNFIPELAAPVMLLETIDPANGNARSLFYFAPTSAFQRLAAEFDRYSRGVTIWSPDSRKLVFTLTYGDSSGTRDWVVETEASGSINPRVLGNGSLAFWSPK